MLENTEKLKLRPLTLHLSVRTENYFSSQEVANESDLMHREQSISSNKLPITIIVNEDDLIQGENIKLVNPRIGLHSDRVFELVKKYNNLTKSLKK